MKKYVFICLLLATVALPAIAKVKGDCKTLQADLKKGTINGVPATASMKEVKKKLPCSTGETDESMKEINCGGGVFFLNHDFYYYTGADYIEIRKKFKGTLSTPIMGASLEEVKKHFGETVRTQQAGSDSYYFFKTDYGSLVVQISNGVVIEIKMYAVSADDIKLCL